MYQSFCRSCISSSYFFWFLLCSWKVLSHTTFRATPPTQQKVLTLPKNTHPSRNFQVTPHGSVFFPKRETQSHAIGHWQYQNYCSTTPWDPPRRHYSPHLEVAGEPVDEIFMNLPGEWVLKTIGNFFWYPFNIYNGYINPYYWVDHHPPMESMSWSTTCGDLGKFLGFRETNFREAHGFCWGTGRLRIAKLPNLPYSLRFSGGIFEGLSLRWSKSKGFQQKATTQTSIGRTLSSVFFGWGGGIVNSFQTYGFSTNIVES